MIFEPLRLAGAVLIGPQRSTDSRGYFARTFCQREFEEAGLASQFVQMSLSHNEVAGTLRGMHFQYPPSSETKVVRCVKGALHDVVVDLRPESPTFLHHVGVDLSASNGLSLYIPPRFGHGFITLEDHTDVLYMMDEFHSPGREGALPFNDPDLAIEWPLPIAVISDRDRETVPYRKQARTLIARMGRDQ